MDLPVFVINLARATDRRKRMEGRLSRLGLLPRTTFVEAVDRDSEEVARLSEGYAPTSPSEADTSSEVACFRSHLKALRIFLAGKKPMGLVLEDDVMFANDFPERFPRSVAALPRDCPLLLLSWISGSDTEPLDDLFVPLAWRTFGAYGYCVRRNYAARVVMSCDRPIKEVPFWFGDRRISEIITLFSEGLRTRELLLLEEGRDSYIGGEKRVEKHRKACAQYDYSQFSKWEEQEREGRLPWEE